MILIITRTNYVDEVQGMAKYPTLLWVLGTVLVASILLHVGWNHLAHALKEVHLHFVLSAFLLHLATLAATGYRWQILLAGLGSALPYRRVMSIYLAGKFADSVTPKGGGDAATVYILGRFTSLPYRHLTGALLVQKFTSLLPLVLICILCLGALGALNPGAPSPAYLLLPALIAAGVMLGRSARNGKRIPRDGYKESRLVERLRAAKTFAQDAFQTSRQLLGTRDTLWLTLISLAIWSLYPLKLYIVALSLDLKVSFVLLATAAYGSLLATMIPIVPGNLGTFEATLILMLTTVGLSTAEGLTLTLLFRLGTYWFPLVLSAVVAARLGVSLFSRAALKTEPAHAGD